MIEGWYFQIGGRLCGPIGPAELKTKVTAGEITRETLVRKVFLGAWVEAGHVKGLCAAADEGSLPALRPVPEPVAALPHPFADDDFPIEADYPLAAVQGDTPTSSGSDEEPSGPGETAYQVARMRVAYERRREQRRRRAFLVKVVGILAGIVVLVLLGPAVWTLFDTPGDPLETVRKAVQAQAHVPADRILTPRPMALPKPGKGFQLYIVPVRPPTELNAPGLLLEYLVLLRGQGVVDVRERTAQNQASLFSEYRLEVKVRPPPEKVPPAPKDAETQEDANPAAGNSVGD